MDPVKPFDYEFYQKGIEKLFLIINRDGLTVPFKLFEAQKKILYSLTGRDIILKARQEGISSLILAIFTLDFLTTDNVRCVVISHEASATQRLFDKVKFYLDSLKTTFPGEIPYKLKYNSRTELVNTERNSIFYVGTAGARAFGHGETINNLHVSELSRYPDQEPLMVGLMQAVPQSGRISIETTANGIGNYFNNLWTRAENNDSSFKPHFLAWFELPEYSRPIADTFVPTEEEKEIAATYKLTNEQLNWRRWKIKELNDNLDYFQEQYPANPSEAFILSGNPIWSPTMMKKLLLKCKDPILVGDLTGSFDTFFQENPKGFLKIWKEPVKGHDYVIGADCAEGLEVNSGGERDERRDYSCAYVLDRMTAEIVACYHGRPEGDLFGRHLDRLGRYYNQAFIGVEKNNQGLAPLIMLRDLNYPRLYYREKIGLDADRLTSTLGWWTDRFTRPLMIDEATKWLREERIMILDKDLVNEMMSFVRYPDGQGRAAKGAFDDRVMSWMITIQMYIRNPFSSTGNDIESQDQTITNMLNRESNDMLEGDLDFSA